MTYTPMMEQFLKIKDQYQKEIVFFRLGDFYEMFFDDALIASKILEIALTARDCGNDKKAPMCGIPYHAAETYITKLINRGYRVAICEQVEDPSLAKGIVKREVVKVITPGTVSANFGPKDNNNHFIASITFHGTEGGIALIDFSTGECYISPSLKIDEIYREISKYKPAEIIIPQGLTTDNNDMPTYPFDASTFSIEALNKLLNNDFLHLKSYFDTLEISPLAKQALGGLLSYLLETQRVPLTHIQTIEINLPESYLVMDANVIKNLELVETLREGKHEGSLLSVIDKTVTSIGKRTIKRWLLNPLLDVVMIKKRHDSVEELIFNIGPLKEIRNSLKDIYDLERLMGKCILGNANGRDLNNLKNSLQMLPTIKSLLNNLNSNYLKQLNEKILLIPELTDLIEQAIKEDPPISIRDGGIIRDGYNGDIDELRSITRDCKNWMADFEAKERESTGIKSLKIGYNKVFGYYIEITKSNLSSVPQYYVRKQTLANGERYITSELKEIENKVLGAEEKLLQLEYQQFLLVRDEVLNYLSVIKTTAKQIGELDVLLSFALTALDNNYSKPILEIGKALEIRDSRHPVVENTIKDSLFVPNDCYMDSDRNRLLIITGPNMAGKSTYMRQIALNIILAQIGSFVPSSYCKVGIIDRIFTRIGATDDLSTGQSTFMVEMNEVSHILKNVTPNSFIILDEVGRGTSTFDGLSIAQAIIEYIITSMPKGTKTLFATHYHELTMLEDSHPGIRNFRVAVKEEGRTIKFLHRIIPGGADKSYGIHVCQLAGLPRPLIKRAFEILDILESQKLLLNKEVLPKSIETKEGQIAFEEIASTNLVKELSKIDPITVTPIEAINILFKIQGEAKKIVEGGF